MLRAQTIRFCHVFNATFVFVVAIFFGQHKDKLSFKLVTFSTLEVN